MRTRLVMTVALAIAMIAALFIGVPARVQAQTPGLPNGPWVDRLVWSEQPNAGVALEQIKTAEGDFFMFSLQGGAQKIDALQSPDVLTTSTYGSVNALLMNPNRQVGDDIPGGQPMNPFTDTQIREAMNWLIDRATLNLEVLDGFAVQFVSPLHPKEADYFRELETNQAIEAAYQGDFARAEQVITDRMTALGAVIIPAPGPGTWQDSFGDVIDIRIIARVEDERLAIGEYVGSQLERVGFKVTVVPSPSSQAIPLVYGGDPSIGAWHIYTEGWAFEFGPAWDDGQIWGYHDCQFEPFCASINPGLGTYVPAADFDQMSQDLAFGNYASLAERQQLMRTLIPRALSEGNYRMWIQAEQAVFAMSSRVQSAVLDSFAGPWSDFTLKTARLVVGEPGVGANGVGGEIRVLNFIGFADAWNPWISPGWLYDAIQRDTFGDPGMWVHPQTGTWLDYRLTTSATTAGPTGTMPVPAAAVVFNVTSMKWEQVGSGVTAVSKVTSSLGTNAGKWHTGQDITMDDVIHGIVSQYRRAFGDVSQHDDLAAGSSTDFYLSDIVKGFEFDLAANSVTVYIDYWHVDNQEIAAAGFTYMSTEEAEGAPVPWEIQEVILQTVVDDRTAIHEDTATSTGRIWLDLGRNPSSIAAIDDAFNAVNGRIPAGMDIDGDAGPGGPVITAAEATARYAAAKAFRDARGHWYASNGPFYLERIDPVFRQSVMVAFRNGYPYTPDHWDQLKVIRVPTATFGTFPSSLLAGAEVATLSVTTAESGQPADPKAVRWFVRQLATGAVPIRGDAVRTGVGDYEVQLLSTLTVGLETGGYELVVIIQGEQSSVTQTFAFSVTSQLDFFAALFSEVENRLDTQGQQLTDLTSDVAGVQASAGSLQTLVTAVLALAVIAIIVPAVMMMLILRRLPGKMSMPSVPEEKPPEEL